MKKFFILSCFVLLCACSKNDDSATQNQKTISSIDKETVFSFNANNLQSGCDNSSEMICTINLAVKCILNPDFSECKSAKDILPAFVFMQDESLQRPTFQSYKISSLTPRSDGSIEVKTQSSCNGNWFGLCNGNITYIMKYAKSKWHISDMYATEF